MSDEFDMNVVKTMDETDKKCPSCDGVMEFDPKTGGLTCPYCGHHEAIKTKEAVLANNGEESAKEISLDDADLVANCDWGTETKTIICKSCGAESIYDMHVISSTCPYCGSNQVTEAGDKKTMAPGGVVPFKIDKKEAGNRFTAWIKKRFFCPKEAKESANPKKFQGIYLPYWTFDANTYSTYTAEFGRDRKVKKGDSDVIVTDWYHTSGSYDKFFDDELVCGSTQHNLGQLRGLEPFNTAENKVYKPEYVAGFGAERYSIGVKDAWVTAKKSMEGKIEMAISSKAKAENHADRVRNVRVRSSFSDMTFKYLLLPVWISSYKYKDKVYQFMVNGQTGRVSGQTPISKIKVFLTAVAVICILVLMYYLLGGTQ